MAWFYNPDTHNMEESQESLPAANQGGDNSGGSYLGGTRAMAYGPSQGEYTHDTLNGPLGQLQQGDIALSPDLIGKYPLGSYVNLVDDQGNVLREMRRVADYSYKSPGNPNRNSLELWNDKDLGHANIVPASGKPSTGYNPHPAAQPTEAGTDNPQVAEIPPPPPAPPSWQDLTSSDSWQNITPDQRQQATDKWYSVAFNYANAQGGFSDDARQKLYNFYQQQRTDVAKVDAGAEVGKFGQQVLSSANEAATKGEQGSYDIASKGAPPPTNSNSIQVQALENAKLKGYDRLPPDQQDTLFNQEVNALEKQNAQDLTDYQNYNAQKAQGLQPRLNEIEKGKPKGYENTTQGQVANAIGSAAPLVATAVASGPLAPLTTAAQMGSSGYEDARQEAVSQLKKLYPDMQPYEVDARANEVAQMAFKANAGAGLAMGSVAAEVPIKNIVGKLIAQTAFGSAVQGAAGAGAKAVTNIGMAENVNPEQDIMEGVPQAGASNAIFGGVAHLAHAIPDAISKSSIENAKPLTPEVNVSEAKVPAPAQPPEAPHPVTATDVTGPETPSPVETREAIKADIQQKYPDLTPAEHEAIANRLFFQEEQKTPDVVQTPQNVAGDVRVEPSTLDESLRTAAGETKPIETSNAPAQEANAPTIDSRAFKGHAEQNTGVQGNDAWVSAIANRYTSERSANGEIGEIAPGEGYSRTDLRNVGLRMKPEEVNQQVSDLMQNKGDAKLQAAAVTAEEARLSQRSAQLSRAAEDNPGNQQTQIDAENAFKDLTDFHNGPVAKLKNNWHAQGMTMQGEVPVDLSTYNGLREAWLRNSGEAPPAGSEIALRRTARSVRESVDSENGSMARLSEAIERTDTRRAPSAEQLRDLIMKRMGEEPCVT